MTESTKDALMSVMTETSPDQQTTSEPSSKLFAVLAEFETPGELINAARAVREAGYARFDCYSPFPIHGIDDAMGTRPTRLPWIVLAGGTAGCLGGLILCGYTMATMIPELNPSFSGYPYLISGKPYFSLAAFIPVIFETTILLSAFAAVFGMLGLNKLPQFYNPLFRSARFRRATSDGFFLAIEAEDPKFESDQVESLMNDLGATAVEKVED